MQESIIFVLRGRNGMFYICRKIQTSLILQLFNNSQESVFGLLIFCSGFLPNHTCEAARVFWTENFLNIFSGICHVATVFPLVAMSLISFNTPLVHGCSIKPR